MTRYAPVIARILCPELNDAAVNAMVCITRATSLMDAAFSASCTSANQERSKALGIDADAWVKLVANRASLQELQPIQNISIFYKTLENRLIL